MGKLAKNKSVQDAKSIVLYSRLEIYPISRREKRQNQKPILQMERCHKNKPYMKKGWTAKNKTLHHEEK